MPRYAALHKKRLLIFVIMLTALFPLFFVGGPTPYSNPLFRALWDCGHIVFFAALMLAVQVKLKLSHWRVIFAISLAVLYVGGAIEIIQAHTGRDGNWRDVSRDIIGAWLGLFWLLHASRWVWCARIVTLLLILPDIMNVFVAGYSQARALQQFPVLANFESAIELSAWQGDIERVELPLASGNHVLKVHFNKSQYANVSLKYFFHSWQGYRVLSFDVYNPDQNPVNLVMRVSDVQHDKGSNLYRDRFNHQLRINSGWSHVEIPVSDILHAPATRLMHLDSIASITLFSMRLPVERNIYLDNVKLQ